MSVTSGSSVSGNEGGRDPMQEVKVTAQKLPTITPQRKPKRVNSLFFRFVINPIFGWTTGPSQGWTNGEILLSLVAAPVIGGSAGTLSSVVGPTLASNAPGAVLSTALAVSPDGITVVAESMDVAGAAETAGQVGLATQRLEEFFDAVEGSVFGK